MVPHNLKSRASSRVIKALIEIAIKALIETAIKAQVYVPFVAS
jgi:hypothetical protein